MASGRADKIIEKTKKFKFSFFKKKKKSPAAGVPLGAAPAQGAQAGANESTQEMVSLGAKDFFFIFGIVLCFSAVSFTAGLWISRQLTLAELNGKPMVEEDLDDELVQVTIEKAEMAAKEEEAVVEKAPEKTYSGNAPTDIDSDTKRARTSSESQFLDVEAKALTSAKKEMRKNRNLRAKFKGVPKDVAGLFEGGAVQRKVAQRKPSKMDMGMTRAKAGRGSKWTLQVGAYPTESEATQRVTMLKSKGIDSAYYEETTVKDKGTWYRVGVGFFQSPQSAQTLGKRLKSTGVIGNYFARKVESGKKK